MNRTVAQLLGETGETVAATDAQVAPPEEAPQPDYSNPSIQQLLALWQSGNHEAVGLRVLDALDAYEDFLELAFQIGHEGAIELGQIMDRLTSTEKSPHRHDTISDRDIKAKLGQGLSAGDTDFISGSPT